MAKLKYGFLLEPGTLVRIVIDRDYFLGYVVRKINADYTIVTINGEDKIIHNEQITIIV